jgi:hypothetical protein
MFSRRYFLCGALATVLFAAAGQAAQGPAVDTLMKEDGLGELRLGQSEAAVIKLLGKPEKEGKVTKQEADGMWVQTWSYSKQGISLSMSSESKKPGTKTVASITATAPCALATRKGIKIGSPEGAPRKAYAAYADHDSPSEPHEFVAGSVYGGIIFQFEHGKVSRIFFGAAAE